MIINENERGVYCNIRQRSEGNPGKHRTLYWLTVAEAIAVLDAADTEKGQRAAELLKGLEG